MAEKRNKVRVDRIIILVLSGILVLGLLGFGIYEAIYYFSNRKESEVKPASDPVPVETTEGVKVTLDSYEIFDGESDNLDFNFIVATLKFESKDPISFDLGNLQTSEKIYLNNVSKYINALEERSYRVSKLNLVNTVVSDKNVYTCNIFIPYTTDSYSLRVLNSVDASMIEFDLTGDKNDVSILKFETEQEIEIGNTNVTVSKCSVSTMMLHNGEEYQVPATMNVYTFNINVNAVEGKVMITDARFVREGSDEVITCMDETYQSVKAENCLGKQLVTGDNGALFFETTSSGSIDYSGSLMLMFSNSNEWVKIPTVLE